MNKSFLTALLIFTTAISGASAAGPVINPPEIDIKTNTVVISGTADTASEKLMLIVLNPNGIIDDADENEEYLQHQRAVYINNGVFSYQLQLNLDGVNDTGDYKIYIGDKGTLSERIFYFASAEERKSTVLDILNSTAAELAGHLSSEENIKMLALDNFAPFLGISKDLLANRLYTALKNSPINAEAINAAGELQTVIKEYALLEAYNQDKPDLCYGSEGVFLYPEIASFDKIDMELNIYNIYTDFMSQSGKAIVRSSLLNKNIDTIADLKKQFITQVILTGMTNPKKNGFEHVYQILTAANMNAVGLSLPGALNDSRASQLASHSVGYSSIAKLQEKINDVFTAKGNTGGGGGSSASVSQSVSSGGITLPASALTEKTEPETTFLDIQSASWAAEAVTELNKKGIINGMTERSFEPNSFVTREQLVKMLCLALNISGNKGTSFHDVEAGSWYEEYVSAAVNAGIVKGKSENLFGTGEAVTRQDVSVMLYRAFSGWNTDASSIIFTDREYFSDYAAEAITALSGVGIISGFDDGSFRPFKECTRAEAAKMVYSVLKMKNLL